MRVAAQITGGRSLCCRIRIALPGFGYKSCQRPLQLSGAEWGVFRHTCSLVPNGGFGFGSDRCLGVQWQTSWMQLRDCCQCPVGDSPTTHNVVSYSDLSYGILSVDHVWWRRGGIRRTSCF